MSEYQTNEMTQMKTMEQDNPVLEKMAGTIAKGNRIRMIGAGVAIVCVIAGVAVQTRNTHALATKLEELNERVTELNTVTEDMASNVNDIMEQGCPKRGNGSVQFQISGSDKPVTYIYPEEDDTETHISLKLYQSEMRYMWPQGNLTDKTYSWDMRADRDGTLYDQNNNEYSYIFWEATDYGAQISEEGFCVKGSDTAEFLRDTLQEIGLTPKEYNEFIVYWLPQMQDNKYNIIYFDGLDPNDIYNQNCELHVTDVAGNPAESVLRVMMVWEPSEEYVEMEPQKFITFERKGFTVVEWGGTEIR